MADQLLGTHVGPPGRVLNELGLQAPVLGPGQVLTIEARATSPHEEG